MTGHDGHIEQEEWSRELGSHRWAQIDSRWAGAGAVQIGVDRCICYILLSGLAALSAVDRRLPSRNNEYLERRRSASACHYFPAVGGRSPEAWKPGSLEAWRASSEC
jgi:hypothetical protein